MNSTLDVNCIGMDKMRIINWIMWMGSRHPRLTVMLQKKKKMIYTEKSQGGFSSWKCALNSGEGGE